MAATGGPKSAQGIVGLARAGVPPAEPVQLDLAADAEAQARRIRALPPSDRVRAAMDLAARTAVLERNVAAGYLEWESELAHLRHVRQLVGVI
jgi:hypothetical protein